MGAVLFPNLIIIAQVIVGQPHFGMSTMTKFQVQVSMGLVSNEREYAIISSSKICANYLRKIDTFVKTLAPFAPIAT